MSVLTDLDGSCHRVNDILDHIISHVNDILQ
jgi:hypothetical protein